MLYFPETNDGSLCITPTFAGCDEQAVFLVEFWLYEQFLVHTIKKSKKNPIWKTYEISVSEESVSAMYP